MPWPNGSCRVYCSGGLGFKSRLQTRQDYSFLYTDKEHYRTTLSALYVIPESELKMRQCVHNSLT